MTRKIMSSENVKYFVLHCSATRCNRDYTVEQLMRDHKDRGFRTIGYHFYIRRDGTMTQHRKLLEWGAHCIPYNRCSIGICYEGGLDEKGFHADTRTEAQTKRMEELLMNLHVVFPQARIVGDRDLPRTVPKVCPCFDADEVFGWIENL